MPTVIFQWCGRSLEEIVSTSEGLVGPRVCLADFHLAPMLAYFAEAPEGAQVLSDFPKLTDWWQTMRQRHSVRDTDPAK
jgi:glutathione S-transferase